MVLAGPGHNGGDALSVARELHLAGIPVSIWCPFERCKPLTEAHLRHARWLGIPLEQDPPDPAAPGLWVDGIFGLAQQRAPGESLESLLAERHRLQPHRLVAIDVPTGLCSDSGHLLGRAAARATVTFCLGLIKQGLVQDPAIAYVGRLERIDLGLPSLLLADLAPDAPLGLGASACLAEADLAAAPSRVLDPAADKYGRGRLLVVAGSARYRGAAHLALAGATASGCGSLRARLPREMGDGLWTVLPHVVLEAPLDSNPTGEIALTDLPLDWLERLDAVLLGPGIGRGAPPEPHAWRQLQAFQGLLVLDADGLNRLAEGAPGGDGAGIGALSWLQGRGGPTWITPHAGEFARLFPDLGDQAPLEAAAVAALRSGAVVLLKGAHSVVASPDGRRWQVLRSCPDAARAGLGDVLAGYAAGTGAMAIAAGTCDDALLAAAGLAHAVAGTRARQHGGQGGATPLAVSRALMKASTD